MRPLVQRCPHVRATVSSFRPVTLTALVVLSQIPKPPVPVIVQRNIQQEATTLAFAEAPLPFLTFSPDQHVLVSLTSADPFEQGWQDMAFERIRTSEYHINFQDHAGALQSPNRAQDLA